MIPSLRQLGLLSARYAEEEALREKQNTSTESLDVLKPTDTENNCNKTVIKNSSVSTVVSAPVPVQKVVNILSSPSATNTCSTTTSLPSSPLIIQSPPTLNTSTDCVPSANIIQIVPGQNSSFPSIEKLQQLGIDFIPMVPPYTTLTTPQGGLLMPASLGFTALSTLAPATILAAPQHYSPPLPPPPPTQYSSSSSGSSSVEVFSSLTNSRVRKPFHKRRPAHMDKNMLFCHFCGRKETPEWRKGPAGPATLCNACGLQWAKKIRAQRSSGSASSKNSSKPTSPVVSSKNSEESVCEVENVKV